MKEKIKVPMISGYVEFTPGRNDDHLVIVSPNSSKNKEDHANLPVKIKTACSEKES